MAEGIVTFVSKNLAMLVVSHEDGHTVVELLGDEGAIEKGDHVSGDWSALGGEPIRKLGEQDSFDTYFQGTWPTFAGAVQVARNTGGG